MRLLFCLLAILILSSTTQAGTYQVVYEQQLPGAENYVHVDPIVGEDGLLAGFIYCDSANQQVIIERFGVDTNVVIDYDRRPVKSINYVSGDTVVVYVLNHLAYLGSWFDFDARIQRLILKVDSLSTAYVEPYIRNPFGGGSGMYGEVYLRDCDISFDRQDGGIVGVTFDITYWDDLWTTTLGPSDELRSQHALYDPELNWIAGRKDITMARYGNLCGDATRERASYLNYYLHYDYSDPYLHPDWKGHADYLAIWVEDSTAVLAHRHSNYGDGYALFVDKFSPLYDYDEMIFYGYAEDLLGLHSLYGDKRSHVACYRFSDTGVTENWYTEISGISLDYVYEPQHYIAGFHGPDRMIAFNYWSGTLCDSVDLDRALLEPTFFETDAGASLLNLVGRMHDSIFVYQFQTPTDIDDQETQPNLPSGFALHQNYPNPFNNETVLNFANDTRQHLTLSVYNVLGRRVAVLHDQPTGAGEHSVSWNGTDEYGRDVASGIYFASLRAETGSSIVKMILLK